LLPRLRQIEVLTEKRNISAQQRVDFVMAEFAAA
jgi:hypothetical protein